MKNSENHSNSSSLLKYSQLKSLLKKELAESDILAWYEVSGEMQVTFLSKLTEERKFLCIGELLFSSGKLFCCMMWLIFYSLKQLCCHYRL
jgi:hypothetical protein